MADLIYYDSEVKEYVFVPETPDDQTETETQAETSTGNK